jgi:hypothetical protein
MNILPNRGLQLLLLIGACLTLASGFIGSTGTSYAGQQGVLDGWNLKTENIDISTAIVEEKRPVLPQRLWIKRDTENTYLLVETRGLKEHVSADKGPVVFLSLYFDSDADPKTGSSGKKIAGQEILGFDTTADLSVMQVRDKDGKMSSVLNCQIARWDGKQFAGELGWGTRFNTKMSASSEGDYASFTIPRSVLDIAPKGVLSGRIAFDVRDAHYVDGKQVVTTFTIDDRGQPTTSPDSKTKTSADEEQYEQFDNKEFNIRFEAALKALAVDSAGKVVRVEGTVKELSVGKCRIELASEQLVMEKGNACVLTKDYGKIRVTFDSNAVTTLWLTRTQKDRLKAIAK